MKYLELLPSLTLKTQAILAIPRPPLRLLSSSSKNLQPSIMRCMTCSFSPSPPSFTVAPSVIISQTLHVILTVKCLWFLLTTACCCLFTSHTNINVPLLLTLKIRFSLVSEVPCASSCMLLHVISLCFYYCLFSLIHFVLAGVDWRVRLEFFLQSSVGTDWGWEQTAQSLWGQCLGEKSQWNPSNCM